MAGDLRRNGASRPTFRRHQPRSCVWWFLLGAIFGSFGVGLYWMMEAPHQVPTTVAAIPGTERPAPPQPSFEFPNILRDTEVEIGRGDETSARDGRVRLRVRRDEGYFVVVLKVK